MDRYEVLAKNREFSGGLKFDFEGDDGDMYKFKRDEYSGDVSEY
jgi:hypothetical protein